MIPVKTVEYTREDMDHVNWYHDRFINPYGPNHWTTVKFDQSALVNIIRTYRVESFLEIGTWEGFTTLCMWLVPGVTRAKSIDVCAEYEVGGSEYHNPSHLKRYARYFDGITPVEFANIDSSKYVPYDGEKYDMVFIDGNHNYEYVKSDFALAQKLSPRVIAFHDFDNGNPGVDKFLEEIVGEHQIFNYKGTAVVYVEAK